MLRTWTCAGGRLVQWQQVQGKQQQVICGGDSKLGKLNDFTGQAASTTHTSRVRT